MVLAENARPEIVWWRDVPVDVEWGLLNHLATEWSNKITVVSANDFEVARKKCNWQSNNKNVDILICSKENDSRIESLIKSDAIHLFSGIRGNHKVYIDRINSMGDSFLKRCALIMESPSLYGKPHIRAIKRLLYPVLYRFYNIKYGKIISAVFTMGEKAKEVYNSYGWNNVDIFPFQYLAELGNVNNLSSEKDDTLKILYIGRFDYAAKGVDILLQAINGIDGNYSLDLVGGYGANAEEVINAVKNNPKINYLGTWDSNSVVNNMKEYDVCIVPSRYDGWNMTPYQAINAGIGCVVSDNIGSQELIHNSKSGVVFPAGDCDSLRKAIQMIINNQNIVCEWKENAVKYCDRISVSTVGNYFIQCLEYAFLGAKEKPQCPWLGEKDI